MNPHKTCGACIHNEGRVTWRITRIEYAPCDAKNASQQERSQRDVFSEVDLVEA
jgi:hypothetical protein